MFNGGSVRSAKRENEFYTEVDIHPEQHLPADAARQSTRLGHKT